MHSSRMRTARSLTVSRRIPCMPPSKQPCMTPPQLRMPPTTMHLPPALHNHACPPGATTQAHPREQPCTCPPWRNHACPPSNHAHAPWEQPHMPPQQPCMPPRGATMHAPPGATTHAPLEQPRMPFPPGATTHAPPEQPCTPPPWTEWDTCKNITFANFVCGR